jgi:Fic family protein
LSPEQKTEIISYGKFSIIKLVFESNTIEGAGTKTFGETERILETIQKKYGEKIKTEDFVLLRDGELFSLFGSHDSELQFAQSGKSFKEYNEVMQHWGAYIQSILHVENFLNQIKAKQEVFLFDREIIKSLHKSLSRGLLEENDRHLEGQFRDEGIFITGLDLNFPSPELIESAMKVFCKRANLLIHKGLTDNQVDIFMIAAQISYEFVRIHPFVNFNGRMSRLLLQMVMRCFGIDFCVVLKGNKKSRHRYMESLRRANAINNHDNFNSIHLEPYATLIAMSLCEGFENINANLKLADLPLIGSE